MAARRRLVRRVAKTARADERRRETRRRVRRVALVSAMVLGLMSCTTFVAMGGEAPPTATPSPITEAGPVPGIPEDFLALYRQAAAKYGIDWAVLAGVGRVECNHGRLKAHGCNPPLTINPKGARGPMQFLGSTWRASADRYAIDVSGPAVADGLEWKGWHGFATDGNGNGVADPWEPPDAIHAAARMLRRNGAPDDNKAALWAYNPSDDYRVSVLKWADTYRTAAASPRADGFAFPGPAELFATAPVDAKHHDYPAWDWPIPTGTPVFAVRGGTVANVSTLGSRCGIGVTIVDAEGARWTYCHGSERHVAIDDKVNASQLVLTSGNTGNSTAPHLHLAIRTADGAARCPQPLLASLRDSGTGLPLTDLPTSGCTGT